MEGAHDLAVRNEHLRARAEDAKSFSKTQKKSSSGRPIGIDLFAGVGGLSLGFEQAGFDVVAAVEIDPVHAAAHHFNFPNCTTIPRSVSTLTGRDIRRMAGIGNADVDVLFGGAPCQGFSLMGHRAIDDPRNSLVRDYVRLVSEIKPKFAVFENVKGLTLGKHRRFLAELIDALEGIGYQVRSPWKVLNAADYGVPQHRERLILLAARKGEKVPEYPAANCSPADTIRKKDDLQIGPSVSAALDDIPDAECFEKLILSDEMKVARWNPKSAYAKEMHCVEQGGWHYGYPRNWNPNMLTSSIRTEHSSISRRRFASALPGAAEAISRLYKLPADGLSNTLRAGTDGARGAFTAPRPIHHALARCVTVREMARLHGFPDWFRFHRTKWHGARQIGNAVPPPLARAVASEVIKALGIKPSRPKKLLNFGAVELLGLDMTEAARYWDVEIPMTRRDRKSGAKKRKQSEIEADLLSVEFA